MAGKKERNRFQLSDLKDACQQMRRLAPYAFPYKARLFVYFIAVVAFSAGNMARALVIEPLLPLMAADANPTDTDAAEFDAGKYLVENDVHHIAYLLLAAAVLMAFGTLGKIYMMQWVMHRSTVDVQRELARKLMGQPVSFFDGARKGELLSRLTYDLSGVRRTFHIVFNDLIHHPVVMLGIIGGMVYTSPILCLGTLILPIAMAPVIFLAGKIKRLSKRSYESHAELTNFFHQFFEGVRVVKAFGMEKQQEKELDHSAIEFFDRSLKVGKYQAISRALVEFVLGIMIAGGLVGGVWVFSTGVLGADITFAKAMQFLFLLILLYDPVRKLTHTINNMSSSMAANDRVFEVMDREPELKDRPDAIAAPSFSKDIVFYGVGFEYLPGRPVLYDINFSAPKGSMTALVGATGAGKSTLLDSIPRFYAPTSGKVTMDGRDLSELKGTTWLEQIAVVSQETFLFNTSIRENLLAADPEANEERLKQALDAANILDEIESLPEGIDTVLGDRGINLSGGQRQRLAIARAFVKRAPILLLDEATSALDTETERKVQAALDKLIQGATVFAIAHRLSTIIHADQILVMDQGRVIESGTHDELLAKKGRYSVLYETQIKPFETQSGEGASYEWN